MQTNNIVSPPMIACALSICFCIYFLTPSPGYGLSIGEEREFGEELLYTMKRHYHIFDQLDIVQYFDTLGKEILTKSGPQFFNYKFIIVESQEFNAFAAPSGLIFLYSGLLDKIENENELTSVMAHEIGHVTNRHIAERLEQNKKINAITMALALAGLAAGDPSLSQGIFTGVMAGGQTMSLSYSRQHEEEADRYSYDLMKSLHRNPAAMEKMLEIMQRIVRYRSDQIPQYLLTHPNPEQRLVYIQSLLDFDSQRQTLADYNPVNNLPFIRIKYRIRVTSDETTKNRDYFLAKLAGAAGNDERMLAKYGLALLDAKERNFTKALSTLDIIRSTYPNWNIILADIALVYEQAGQQTEALKLLRMAENKDPNDMYITFNLARLQAKNSMNQEAKNLFMKVIDQFPYNTKVYYELGRLESHNGTKGNTMYYLGKHYMLEGRFKLAQHNLQQAVNDSTTDDNYREDAKELLKLEKHLNN